jgi:regulator of cell morphogenesis and NO signaling
MTATPSATIRPSDKLGDLVNAHPQLTPTLERMQLDYCCGGHRSLAEACGEAGLDVGEAIDTLQSRAAESSAAPSSLQALAHATPSALADHIVQTHHTYLRGELPRLSELAERVMTVHGGRHPELADVRDTFAVLRADLEPHLDREEQILFPLVREIDAAARSGSSVNGELENPVSVLEDDHEQVGALLARLRELTHDFTAPTDGCASYRALYDGLHCLTDDTHLHVHKENNILFPAAIERERQLRERIGA